MNTSSNPTGAVPPALSKPTNATGTTGGIGDWIAGLFTSKPKEQPVLSSDPIYNSQGGRRKNHGKKTLRKKKTKKTRRHH